MNPIIVLLTAWVGMYGTFWVSVHLRQGSVRASAGLTLLVALICYQAPIEISDMYREEIPIIFFGATFMGMVSKEVVASWHLFVLSSIVYTIVYSALGNSFVGYGGGLGMKACISLITALGIDYIWIGLNNKYKRIK